MAIDTSQLNYGNLSDQIHAELRRRILTGAFEPGEKLSEPSIAATYGVSRGPVREALRRLVSEGLVVQEPRKGVQVPSFDLEMFQNLSELRQALETASARLAAIRATDETIAGLKRLLSETHDIITHGSSPGYPGEFDVHAAISLASNNPVLIAKIQETDRRLQLARLVSGMSDRRVAPAYEEHVDIVDAIAAHNPDRAEAAMRSHLQRAFAHGSELLRSSAHANTSGDGGP